MHIRGFIGIIFLICVAMVFSTDRKRINLRIIGACLLLQAGIGLLVLRVPSGQAALRAISDMVTQVLSYGSEGARFLFGGWSVPACMTCFPTDPMSLRFRCCLRWSMSAR